MSRDPLPRVLLLCLAILSGVLVPSTALAGQRLLRLEVSRLDQEGRKHPAAGASVVLLGYDNAVRAQAQGRAQLFLPEVFEPGDPLTLHVSLEGHQLFQPSQGRLVVPRHLETEVVEVVLLPLGSKRFLSPEAIEQLVEEVSRRANEQVRPEGREPIDVSRYVREWAVKYGFGYEEVAAEVARWAAEVERHEEDGRKRALAAFLRRDFRTTARYASESAERTLRRLARVRSWRKHLEGKVVRDLMLEAEAHVRSGDPGRALAAAREALRYVSREEDPETWAALERVEGRALLELGSWDGEEVAWACLERVGRASHERLQHRCGRQEKSP